MPLLIHGAHHRAPGDIGCLRKIFFLIELHNILASCFFWGFTHPVMSKKLILSALSAAVISAGSSHATVLLQGYEFTEDGNTLGFIDQGERFVETVANGFYTAVDGPSGNVDYQLRNSLGSGDSGTLPAQGEFTIGSEVGQATTITFRLRLDGGTAGAIGPAPLSQILNAPQLFIIANDTAGGTGIEGSPVTFAEPTLDEFQIFTVDLLTLSPTAVGTTFSSIRLDPRQQEGGFTLDYIRIEGVPEPSAALLSVLGLGAFLVRRRRS